MDHKVYHRVIEKRFLGSLKPNHVTILYGARGVGKTFFLKQISDKIKVPSLTLNGEDMATASLLGERNIETYRSLVGQSKLVLIDEAQKIRNIELVLKLMVDELEGIGVIASGSSNINPGIKSDDLLNGKKTTLYLFPIAQKELAATENPHHSRAKLEERMIYGSYPEVLNLPEKQDKEEYLGELINSFLIKEVFTQEGIRNSSLIITLLKLMALRVGKEVSLDEIGKQIGINKLTVARYLQILSNAFVIHQVKGLRRNLGREVSKSSKWYFYDNGLRNTLISNFNPLNVRSDADDLWENFLVGDRLKFQHYMHQSVYNFFWRTYQQQAIDWIEERSGILHAFQFKWTLKKKVRAPSAFVAAYPGSTFDVITPENYLSWIT